MLLRRLAAMSLTPVAFSLIAAPAAHSSPQQTVAIDQSVPYLGLRISAPARWPVINTAETPTACVRYDRAAVYLGAATSLQQCPARLSGVTTSMQVQRIKVAPVRSTVRQARITRTETGITADLTDKAIR